MLGFDPLTGKVEEKLESSDEKDLKDPAKLGENTKKDTPNDSTKSVPPHQGPKLNTNLGVHPDGTLITLSEELFEQKSKTFSSKEP